MKLLKNDGDEYVMIQKNILYLLLGRSQSNISKLNFARTN